jgi:hypothetical protein
MKRKIILISLILFILSMFAFCTGSGGGNVNPDFFIPTENKTTEFDKYFADETPAMWNNVWVHNTLEEDPNAYIIYNLIIGITNLKIENDQVAISYKLITDTPLGGGWGQDKKTISIRQGEAFPDGKAPKFRCKGGITRDESGNGTGLIDYDGATYTSYDGLVPGSYEKEKFETELLAKLSEEEKQYVLSFYEHGTAPAEIEGWRFDALIMGSLKDKKEAKDVMNAAYKKERPTAKWYKLQEGADVNKVLEILATIPTITQIERTYDYKKYYILKHDLVEDNREGILFLGLKKVDYDKLAEMFFKVGFIPCLQWTLFFDTKVKDRESGEERTFDITKPFRLVEACTTGCYDFRGVWVKE